jgi:hypothetical protein
MPEITVHFVPEGGADPEVLAQKVREQLAEVPSVESAQAEVMRSRSLDPVLAMSTIMAVIHYTPLVLDSASKIIESLTRLAKQYEAFRSVVVEIRGKKIPVAELKPEDLGATGNPAPQQP